MRTLILILLLTAAVAAGSASAQSSTTLVSGCGEPGWLGAKVAQFDLTRLEDDVTIAQNPASPSNPLLAVRRSLLSSALFANGDLDRAESLFQLMVAEWEKSGAVPDGAIAKAFVIMAEVENCRQQYDKAEKLFLRAVIINEKVESKLILSLKSLAGFYYQQGRFAEGRAAFARFESMSASSGKNPPLEMQWANLQTVELYRKGDLAAAKVQAQTVVQKYEGDVQTSQQLQKTLMTQLQALDSAEQPKSEPAASTPNASASEEINTLSQRRTAVQAALRKAQRELGQNQSKLASELNAQAELHHSQRQFSQAEPLYLRALGILEQLNQRKTLPAGRVLSDLGLLYRARGQNEKAQSYQTQALEVLLPVLGREHPDVIECEAELAFLGKQPAQREPLKK